MAGEGEEQKEKPRLGTLGRPFLLGSTTNQAKLYQNVSIRQGVPGPAGCWVCVSLFDV